MSNEEIETLLPSAHVSIFVSDEGVRQAAEHVSDDWRYARVAVEVYKGDIATAIETVTGAATTHDLIVIETSRTDETLTEQLETLAEHCHENTAAIVIGPVNDVYLYRTLIGMGVSDYLVPPIDERDFADIIARTLIERLGLAGSRLITFVGAKGGVGTSAITRAAGQAIANKLGQKTVILDAAGGWSYLSVAMGTEPATTMRWAVRAARDGREDDFMRIMYNVNERLAILNSGGDPMLETHFDTANLEQLIDRLAGSYPVVLFDASMAPATAMRTVIARANATMIVSTPNLPALRAARGLMNEIGNLRGGNDEETGVRSDVQRSDVELVINMQGANTAFEVAQNDLPDVMGTEPGLTLPYNPKAFLGAESRNERIGDSKAGEQVLETLMPLVRRHVQVSERDRREHKSDDIFSKIVNWIRKG